MASRVTRENFLQLSWIGFGICVLLFLMDAVVAFYLADDWISSPSLGWWLVWGFVVADGLVMWWVFRQRALRMLTEEKRTSGFSAELPALVLRELIFSWAGILIVGIAGLVAQFTGDGLPLVVSSAMAVGCFAATYPTRDLAGIEPEQ